MKAWLTFKSPEMLAPAKIPVAAGKNIAKTEKKSSPFLKSGTKLDIINEALKRIQQDFRIVNVNQSEKEK